MGNLFAKQDTRVLNRQPAEIIYAIHADDSRFVFCRGDNDKRLTAVRLK